MTENHNMRFPQRSPGAWEWNLNTIVQLVGLAMLAITAAGVWFGLRSDVQDLMDWRSSQEIATKERRGEIEADLSRLGTQGIALDDRLDAQEVITSRISDRLSAAEARGAEVSQTIRELQSSINAQGGDLKVILAWIEEQRRQAAAKR